jgi:ribosomal protein L2
MVTFIRQTWPEKQRWWQLLLPFIIAGAGFGADHLVATDYEKVETAIENVQQYAIDQQPEKIAAYISEDYSDSAHKSKEQLINFCRRRFNRPLAEKVKTLHYQPQIGKTEATVELNLIVHLDPESNYAIAGNFVSVGMVIHLKKDSEKNWLISGSSIISINDQKMGWGAI